ncbi:MAG: hypothetical protein ACON4R_02060 [Akkermansiaceae bacterium]
MKQLRNEDYCRPVVSWILTVLIAIGLLVAASYWLMTIPNTIEVKNPGSLKP